MDNLLSTKIKKIIKKRMKDSLNNTKKCFMLDCENKVIKAHSISKSRFLNRISSEGKVIQVSLDINGEKLFELMPIGKAKASTFPGFCDDHDKIFAYIDNNDYVPGNKHQEFLFAYRSLAREYTVRIGVQRHLEVILSDYEDGVLNIPITEEGIQGVKEYFKGYSVGTKELKRERIRYNTIFKNSAFYRLHTTVVELTTEYPIVAASIFKLEKDILGNLINDNANLKSDPKPLFLSIIPQRGKTYCILSWHANHEQEYSFLRQLNNQAQEFKKVVISNMLIAHVENFAINSEFYNSIKAENKKVFLKYFMTTSFDPNIPFILDPKFSIFS